MAPRKRRTALLLPLTDAVGATLVRYLRRGRPASPWREVFLRVRAPAGSSNRRRWARPFRNGCAASGLPIPFHGPHCLRHSYALHLLRQGVSLKTLGDLLGHRLADSTCVYLAARHRRSSRRCAHRAPAGRTRLPAGATAMTRGPVPTSMLEPVIARYVALKTALGRQYALERRTLAPLDAFLPPTAARPPI